MHILDYMKFSHEEVDFYEGRMKWLRDEKAVVKSAEQRGLEQGIEKGRCYSRNKERYSNQIIHDITEVPIERIEVI